MTLSAGSRLGPYEIVAALGAGGMGEVYRARDTKLDRAVAIKIVPESFAHDPERLARFEREAKTLAALNHPNIAIVYGFEDANGVQALAMELVEGPTLADRITVSGIPLDEALLIARQIADALDTAHDHRIIHRDLKPANIKLRPDGAVKVLDFGLAKVLSGDGGVSVETPLSQSPTMTSPAAMTGVGIILGTAPYMSPEQAKGRPVDERSDIWAFGCVLYEMLSGARAFPGDDVSDTLAAVLRAEPDWQRLPAGIPTSIRRLLRRCLQKDRKLRLADAADARLEIDDALLSPSPDAQTDRAPAPRVPLWRKGIPAAVIAVAALVSAYGAWTLKPESARAVTRFPIALADGQTFSPGRHWVAVSPDGTRLAYTADNRLYLRPLDQLDAISIAGGADPPLGSPRSPFFSPDSQWIGFWQAGQLKKVSVSGGAPVTLCPLEIPPFGASWADDNTILVSVAGEEISRVSAAGGTLQRIITIEAGQRAHGPQLLPDGRSLLFTLARTTEAWDEAQVVMQSIDGGARQPLIKGSDGRYVPTGHLLYALGDTVLAVAFDPVSRTTTGTPVPVLKGVRRQQVNTPAAQFAVSPQGTLAYVPASTTGAALRTLVWLDRKGREEAMPAPPRQYASLNLAPDGTRLALDIDGDNRDIWVMDVSDGRMTRVTTERGGDAWPVWTPDGKNLIFSSDRIGVRTNLFLQAANGTGTAEQLSEGRSRMPYSISGGRLVLRGGEAATGSDLLILDIGERRSRAEPAPLLQTPFEETSAEISPDGNWLAYQSNSSGVFEVYVRPFPDVLKDQQLISTGGGTEPLWGSKGRELFYRDPTGAVMRVPVVPGSMWAAGAPARLFDAPSYAASASGLARTYDVSPDGSRFVMMKNSPSPQTSTGDRIIVVQHWFDELKRLMSPK